eukprot:1158893-Pelagomonas_calceolata.AAC.5
MLLVQLYLCSPSCTAQHTTPEGEHWEPSCDTAPAAPDPEKGPLCPELHHHQRRLLHLPAAAEERQAGLGREQLSGVRAHHAASARCPGTRTGRPGLPWHAPPPARKIPERVTTMHMPNSVKQCSSSPTIFWT